MRSRSYRSGDRIRVAALAAILAAIPPAGCNPKLSSRVPRAAQAPPFVVEEVSPPDGATGVPRGAAVRIQLSAAIDRATLGERPVILARADDGRETAGSAALEEFDTRLVFTPAAPLDGPGVRYRVALAAGLRSVERREIDLAGGPVPVPSSFTTLDDRAPPVFQGIARLEVISSSSLRASWNPAGDDFTPAGEIVYRVYRSEPPDDRIDYALPAFETAPGALEALLTGLAPDALYAIGVRAVDGAGNEDGNTAAISARTPAERDIEPPRFDGIAELGAPAPSATALLASWRAASDDRDDPASIRYRIYAAPAPVAAAELFRAPRLTTIPGVTSAMIADLPSDTLHAVAVRAVDTSDNEDANAVILEAATLTSFARDVFPVFARDCALSGCHAAASRRGGLSLATHADAIRGGSRPSPPAIVPGNASGSLIIWRTDRSSPSFIAPQMPLFRTALSPDTILRLRRWIDQGALNN